MRTHLSFKGSNEEYESFKETVNDSALLFGIGDEVMFGDDRAFELARSIYVLKYWHQKDQMMIQYSPLLNI